MLFWGWGEARRGAMGRFKRERAKQGRTGQGQDKMVGGDDTRLNREVTGTALRKTVLRIHDILVRIRIRGS
jgi:hypothetical protein